MPGEMPRARLRRAGAVAVLLAGALSAQAARAAQEPLAAAHESSLLARRARLVVRDVPLLTALERLTKTSGVVLAFSPSLLAAYARRVDCDCHDLTVDQALARLLESTPFRYQELRGEILISLEPVLDSDRWRPPGTAVHLAMPASTTARPPILHTARIAAQDTTLTGTVVDAATGRPIAGAQVVIQGTTRGTLTDGEGRFRIAGLRTREVALRVVMIGYKPLTTTVAVGAANLRLTLEQTAIGLEQIVVTATGTQRVRELGSGVSRVRADSVVQAAPVTTVAELLTGRAPGVFIRTVAGTSVGGSRIRIRGSSSLSLANEPLVYVDGVRINTDPGSISFATNGQLPARINDINPDEIESIDVLKGPAASTLYGTEAANGVILITTKSGAGAGRVQWRVWGENGRITDRNAYPPNYEAVDAQGRACPLTAVRTGTCRQAEVRVFNLLLDPETRPFRTGHRGVLGGSVAGRAGEVNYFVSGELERQQGVYDHDAVRKVNLRANFGIRPAPLLDIQVNSAYTSSDLELFAEGGTALGPVTNAMAGRARPDGWFQFSPQQIAQIDSDQRVDRFIGSATVRLHPAPWLQLRSVLGLDAVSRDDERLFPVGAFPGARAPGVREVGRNQTLTSTAEFLARMDLPLTPTLASRTSIGAQFFRDRSRGIFSTGQQLVPGSNSLTTAAQTTTREETTESRTLGVLLDQQLSLHDRVFVSVGARTDDNSNFGREFDFIVYPKASASWVVSDEPGFPRDAPISSLRLRAAWGQSGSQPGAADALQFYSAYPATTPDGRDQIGVTFDGGSLGNPRLKPERSSEAELGFDLGLFRERIALSFTYYEKHTVDALVFRELAPSVGASSGRWENLGQTRNRGVEGLLEARLLQHRALRLSLTVNASYNENELLELGEGVAPLTVGTNQRHVEGFPLGAYWARTIRSFEDANGDKILTANEVSVTDTAVYLGEVYPPFQASVQPTLELWDRVRLAALFDLRYGQKLYNFTEGFRCNLATARGRNDPTTPLDEQARCIAHALLGVPGGYVQDAGFTKLRELSVTFFLPRRWTRAAGLETGTVTIAGANLATWTRYPGVDPEANSRGLNFNTLDFFQPGPTRHWTVRFNLGF